MWVAAIGWSHTPGVRARVCTARLDTRTSQPCVTYDVPGTCAVLLYLGSAASMHVIHILSAILHGCELIHDARCLTRITASATGIRTRVARVRAEYPNQLDYGGVENTP